MYGEIEWNEISSVIDVFCSFLIFCNLSKQNQNHLLSVFYTYLFCCVCRSCVNQRATAVWWTRRTKMTSNSSSNAQSHGMQGNLTLECRVSTTSERDDRPSTIVCLLARPNTIAL